jgi:hypothetical protein
LNSIPAPNPMVMPPGMLPMPPFPMFMPPFMPPMSGGGMVC